MASHKFTAILHIETLSEDESFGDNADVQKEIVANYASSIIEEMNAQYRDKIIVSMPEGAVQEMLDIDTK